MRDALSSDVTLILAPLPLLDRHPDSGTHTVRVRAAIFTERQSEQRLENERCIRSKHKRQPGECEAAGWPSRSLSWLFLRELPLKERFTVVDTASKPTLSPLRTPRRARDEKWLLLLDAREKSCIRACVSYVLCWEL